MSNLKDTLFHFMEFISINDICAEGYVKKRETVDRFLRSDFHLTSKVSPPKIKITLSEWHYKCGDGCCDHYGTDVIVNGNKINTNSEDTSEVLRAVFDHLGFDIEVEQKYDYE